MKNIQRILSAVFAFALFFAISAPEVQAQWTNCGMPLDFGDYYDDIPSTNPGDMAIQPTVHTFPNPTSERYMMVVVQQLEQQGTLQLFDLNGRKHREVAINHTDSGNASYRLSLEGLATGTYIVSVTDGDQRISKKVLVR